MDEQKQSLMVNPMQLISQNFGWLNITAFTGWLAGTITGEAIAMQLPTGVAQAAWWQHSAVISAFVVALFMLAGKLLDQYFKGRTAKQERDDKLHAQEVEFWKTQLNIKHLSEFEARSRSHRLSNEITRIHTHVYACHSEMSCAGLQIPDFKLKFYDELMNGLDEEVARFKGSLAEKFDEAIHKTEK